MGRDDPAALLAALYADDQREHAAVPAVGTGEYRALRERDRVRRAHAVVAIDRLREHDAISPADLFHAAWLFNHGELPDDAKLAHELAREAAERGHLGARLLAAELARAEEMTRHEPQPPTEDAPAWLVPALRRWRATKDQG
jgi:hypothetical protein